MSKRRKEPGSPPTAIGRYLIERELARGGMGVIYLARDPRLERQVAIKVLPDGLADDDEFLRRFEREARVLASLNHPNIGAIYEIVEAQNSQCLILELVPGETLKERLAGGALAIEEALSVVAQIAAALAVAHERGIVHRDLKPANVKLTPENVVKVLDFGVAKVTRKDGTPDPALTASDGMLGTAGYLSPEAIDGLEVDERADVWAIGCLLYECLTGTETFPGRTAFERLSATVEKSPDWARLPPGINPRIQEILRRCLEKDPAKRLATAAPIVAEIALVLAHPAASANEAPRPAHARPHARLPRSLTTFIGRAVELETIAALVKDSRLVTLTGMGGSGKTRLAIEVAGQLATGYSDGVAMVELAPLTDATLVPQAVAQGLGVGEDPGRSITLTLVDWLATRRLLLVLDNCEHLLGACAELVEALLRGSAGLTILASSREALGVAGEALYSVPPLSVPELREKSPSGAVAQDPSDDALAALASTDAVRLFVERARLVLQGFTLDRENAAAITRICRSLDGVPLAIELAAARVKMLAVEDIAARLDDRFRLLKSTHRTVVPRHQTLRATIDWSYEHLSPQEMQVFARFSVFAGGFTLDAAEFVCAGESIASHEVLDLLTHLVDKSLVLADRELATRRYRLLETVRQYAWERVREAGTQARLKDRHLAYLLALASDAEPHMAGPRQPEFLDRLEREHENLRAALEWCRQRNDSDESGLRLAGSLYRFWDRRGYWNEGRAQLRDIARRAEGRPETKALAKVLDAAGFLACRQGDYATTIASCGRALAIYQRLGDDVHGAASCLEHLGYAALDQADFPAARRNYEIALDCYRRTADKSGVTRSLNSLGLIEDATGDYAAAHELLAGSLEVARELGDRSGIAAALNNLGLVAKRRKNFDEASRLCSEALELSRALNNRGTEAINLENLGEIAQHLGDFPRALELRRQSIRIVEEMGDRPSLARGFFGIGAHALATGDTERAMRLLGFAEALRTSAGIEFGPADRAEHDAVVDTARAQIGETALASAWANGAALSLEVALDLVYGRDSATRT